MKQPATVRYKPPYPVGAHVSTFIDGFGELPCTVLQVRTQRRKYAKHYLVDIHFDGAGVPGVWSPNATSASAWLRRVDLAPGWPQ